MTATEILTFLPELQKVLEPLAQLGQMQGTHLFDTSSNMDMKVALMEKKLDAVLDLLKKSAPAGKFLVENGVAFEDFNSYGSRRGNDRVMTRGTFANFSCQRTHLHNPFLVQQID